MVYIYMCSIRQQEHVPQMVVSNKHRSNRLRLLPRLVVVAVIIVNMDIIIVLAVVFRHVLQICCPAIVVRRLPVLSAYSYKIHVDWLAGAPLF